MPALPGKSPHEMKVFSPSNTDMVQATLLRRAPWVLPGRGPVIEDGAVLVRGRTIEAVGRYADIARIAAAGTRTIDHPDQALIPGLVNAHTHLEWSGLAGRIPLPQNGFPAWLQAFNRERAGLSGCDRAAAVAAGRRALIEAGTAACADVGCTLEPFEPDRSAHPDAAPDAATPPTAEACPELFLFEVLGFNQTDLHRVAPLERLAAHPPAASGGPMMSLAAHGCYSTSAALIAQAKAWTRMRGLPFSIHVAEHREELELLQTGTGFFRDFLESLGRWVPTWTPPATSPVGLLDSLGVLDSRTLLVHAVHLSAADWDLVARRDCKVCFCPRSNAAINVGRPDLAAALERGIATALGTDSLASNQDLNLFREAARVLDAYPEIRSEQVLRMITVGGAVALGCEDHFGSLARGRSGHFPAVAVPARTAPKHLVETIIAQGAAGKWQWTRA